MLRDFEPRLYQQTIFASASKENTLVVLPTGLGKTYIFLMLAAHRLKEVPKSKIVLLGPTRPLVNQYYNLFAKHLEVDKENMQVFTGKISPDDRERLWKEKQIIFSTPQGFENDVISNKINLKNVSLLGFDEAHRATGEYSYVWIAEQYMKNAVTPLISALTASPGSNLAKITEVTKNLYIDDVEIRTDDDPDVKPYIQDVEIKWIYVELDDKFKRIKKHLDNCFDSKIKRVSENFPDINNIETKRDLLAARRKILDEMSAGNKDYSVLKSLSLIAEAIKVQHASELLESQGISPLIDYMEKLNSQAVNTKVKAVKNLVRDLNFKSAFALAKNAQAMNIEHPKYKELKNLLKKYGKPGKKIILFSQFRDSIKNLVEEINRLDNIKAEMFVGQAKKSGTGMTQKEQIKKIEEFENDDFNVIVMSSVGEEGLDIPSVDVVIFYEPVPSAIRTIQRRGRTGRQEKGKVFVLVTKDTRDEGYRWASYHKEKRMHRVLKKLKKKFNPEEKTRKNKKITEFIAPDKKIKIYADYREKGSSIIKKLLKIGIDVRLETLEIGDYLLSSEICVEHKTVKDFVDSLIDKRIFSQLKEMKKYPKQLIIIQGNEDIFSQRKIHPNAIRGLLSTIAIDYSVPILRAKNEEDAALLMAVIAKREQMDKKEDFTTHSTKPLTLKEQQEYIISALPGVGHTLARPLLKEFKSVKKIINASEKDLQKVDLIGKKKASKIKEITDSDYD